MSARIFYFILFLFSYIDNKSLAQGTRIVRPGFLLKVFFKIHHTYLGMNIEPIQ